MSLFDVSMKLFECLLIKLNFQATQSLVLSVPNLHKVQTLFFRTFDFAVKVNR